MQRGVFLDRDGVIIEDVGFVTRSEQARILPGVPQALAQLRRAGFRLVVVSNQAVVARGLASEADVMRVNGDLQQQLESLGSGVDEWRFCPHHPHADDERYRVVCRCRKPEPGMLVDAAASHGIDLSGSFLVGDRPSDIAAGAAAGCQTVWVETGRHADAPIVSTTPLDESLSADHRCADLPAAAAWIMQQVNSAKRAKA